MLNIQIGVITFGFETVRRAKLHFSSSPHDDGPFSEIFLLLGPWALDKMKEVYQPILSLSDEHNSHWYHVKNDFYDYRCLFAVLDAYECDYKILDQFILIRPYEVQRLRGNLFLEG